MKKGRPLEQMCQPRSRTCQWNLHSCHQGRRWTRRLDGSQTLRQALVVRTALYGMTTGLGEVLFTPPTQDARPDVKLGASRSPCAPRHTQPHPTFTADAHTSASRASGVAQTSTRKRRVCGFQQHLLCFRQSLTGREGAKLSCTSVRECYCHQGAAACPAPATEMGAGRTLGGEDALVRPTGR